MGEPAPGGNLNSTVNVYNAAGTVVASWTFQGKCDGLTADPANNRLLASVNEDGSTGFYVLRPGGTIKLTVSGAGVITGGLDDIVVQGSKYYVATSNPSDSTQTLLGAAAIDENARTLTVTSLVHGNDAATDGDPNGTSTAISVTDPDSAGS